MYKITLIISCMGVIIALLLLVILCMFYWYWKRSASVRPLNMNATESVPSTYIENPRPISFTRRKSLDLLPGPSAIPEEHHKVVERHTIIRERQLFSPLPAPPTNPVQYDERIESPYDVPSNNNRVSNCNAEDIYEELHPINNR